MFVHYERIGRCEWHDGGLKEFVLHYNRERGTAYALSQCLDVERNGGATPKQPEVLLADKQTGQQMVIERKTIVWPSAHIQRHKNEHKFAEVIWAHTNGWFGDRCYELTVSAADLENLDWRTVCQLAAQIGSHVAHLGPQDLPVRNSTPIHWEFRRTDYGEYGDRRGIVVVHQRTPPLAAYTPNELAGVEAEISRLLSEAALKFSAFSHTCRLVLLDFVGGAVGEDDVEPLLSTILIPTCIDEIWFTKPDWVSEDNYEIGFERVFARTG